MRLLISNCILFSMVTTSVVDIPAEKRLRDYLVNKYRWQVRPVKNYTDRLFVFLRFRLIRILELNIKDQVISLNVKIEHEWTDYKLEWNPAQFNGITRMILPSSQIWLPDIQLYNSHGTFQLNAKTALVHWNGLVKWFPTAIATAFCLIEVRYYPFDIQSCNVSLGSWTYDESKLWITLKDLPENERESRNKISLPIAMDLRDYQSSSEWDLISVPGMFLTSAFACCVEIYPRISFNLTFRRHVPFYLVNLILPLLALSYLSILVFYLPADSGEKITLCVTLLASQTTFLLLMMDNIPVTSLAVPLLGKVIIFNMFLSFSSILCTTIVLSVYYRKPTTHHMPNWVRNLRQNRFLQKLLFMGTITATQNKRSGISPQERWHSRSVNDVSRLCRESLKELKGQNGKRHPSQIQRAFQNVILVREYMQQKEEMSKEREHWKFLAAMMDRVFLILFNSAFFIGMLLILLDAPALFDQRKAIDNLSPTARQPVSPF